jgi:hypothetical protein
MAYYRCYFIDEASHVYDFAEFESDTDEQALERARHLCPSRVSDGFELWQQIRLVHRHESIGLCRDEYVLPPSPSTIDLPRGP